MKAQLTCCVHKCSFLQACYVNLDAGYYAHTFYYPTVYVTSQGADDCRWL